MQVQGGYHYISLYSNENSQLHHTLSMSPLIRYVLKIIQNKSRLTPKIGFTIFDLSATACNCLISNVVVVYI